MNKKQIITLIVIGIIVLGGSFFITYKIQNKNTSSTVKPNEILKLKDYTLEYATYVGEEKEYDPETKKTNTKKVKIKVTKDSIDDQKYKVKDNFIYIKDDILMYEVTGNNEFTLLAGAGVDFKLEK